MTTGQAERLFPPLAAGEGASRLLLASAWEVISRQLRLMAQAGRVALGRSSLQVRDPAGLMRLRDGSG